MTERDRCERWFVRRGLPHLIDDYTATDDIFTRMAPFLAGVVFLEFFLAFGDRWTGWSQAVAFLGGYRCARRWCGAREPHPGPSLVPAAR